MSGGSGARLGTGPDGSIDDRVPYLIALVLIVYLLFGLRLFQLQILQGEQFEGIAKGNAVRQIRLEAPRGELVDREGRVLATTRPAFGVSVMPSDLRSPERTLGALGMLLDVDPAALGERIGTPRGRLRFQPVRLAADLSFDHWGRVESHRFELPGVITDVRPRRYYVGGDFASHLLGTIGEIRKEQLENRDYDDYRAGEIVGQSGLEKLLEPDLRGRAGGRNVVVDVAGRVVEILDERAPAPGGSVALSVDIDLQRAAEASFLPDVLGEPSKMGAVVALDPRNGDVLALVSKPSFDPNSFAGGIDSETWKKLTTDPWRPLQNRAISGQYPPGSVYKAIVALAALEDHVIDPREKVYCPGYFHKWNHTYRCWKRGGHGEMMLRDAIKQSCDVWFYEVGLRLGVDRLAHFAKAFQLGSTTGFPFGDEKAGLVPTRDWKARRFGEAWQKGETISIAIGQGFNLTTPMQLAVAYAAIANGGVILEPRIVLERFTADGEAIRAGDPVVRGHVPVAPESLARVRDALEAVVMEDHGTARRARVPGVRVAGKTGTAQVVKLKHTEDLEDDEIPIKYRDHAWFVGFAPADAAEIVVVALVEHGGGGGAVAAPVAQRVMAAYFEKKRARSGESLAVRGAVDAGR